MPLSLEKDLRWACLAVYANVYKCLGPWAGTLGSLIVSGQMGKGMGEKRTKAFLKNVRSVSEKEQRVTGETW